MMTNHSATIRIVVVAALLFGGASLAAQTTTTGIINARLVHENGIALVFDTDPAGVTLGAAGTAAATLNFGNVSAFGPLAAGVTRPAVTAASYTLRTVFDVRVDQGGLASTTYTLRAQLASALPTGCTFRIDGVTLAIAASNVQVNGSYNIDVAHNLDLVVSTAAPGAGGPVTGTPLTTVINFQASAN